jgi:hypothetical protein
MTNITVAADFQGRPSLQLPPSNHQPVNPDAFLRRMERLNARRNDSRTGAVNSAPQHPDAGLLKERDALNVAWAYEVNALILTKRFETPESDALARTARAATAAIARRFEATKALTLDGLQAKAWASLWSRHGEPLATDILDDETFIDARIATSTLRDP